MRNHPKGEEYTDEVFKLLEDRQIGREAGKTIGSIALNNDGVLTKQNYSVIRVSSYSNAESVLTSTNFSAFCSPKVLFSRITPSYCWVQRVQGYLIRIFCATSLPNKNPSDAYLQESYLVALAALIRGVPKATYVHLMPTVSLQTIPATPDH